jgi:hypothetical protein
VNMRFVVGRLGNILRMVCEGKVGGGGSILGD